MEEERVREEIDGILANGVYGWRNEHPLIRRETIDQILAIKLGSRTLKEWIELYEKGKLRIEADDQSLPAYTRTILNQNPQELLAQAREDMLKAGFVKVL